MCLILKIEEKILNHSILVLQGLFWQIIVGPSPKPANVQGSHYSLVIQIFTFESEGCVVKSLVGQLSKQL